MLDTKRKNNKNKLREKGPYISDCRSNSKKVRQRPKNQDHKAKVISIHIKWNEFYEKLRQ